MEKMLTFDSFTIVPAYSDIDSRAEVDISTTIGNLKSNLPIINANMHAICTPEMVDLLSDKYHTFSSYHRFFKSGSEKTNTIKNIRSSLKPETLSKFFPSIGVNKEDYVFVDFLSELGIKNIIIDVNHGHHMKVKEIIKYIKDNHKHLFIMAGNVSTNDGINFLYDAGADIIKAGNSFGYSCSTISATSVGVHPMHVAACYAKSNGKAKLCLDGGIRNTADIAKSLIFGHMVMIGKMLAGTDEAHGKIININNEKFSEYYGNASVVTKQVIANDNTHIKNIEGKTTLVPYVGSMNVVLKSIEEGLQSAFSFVGARNLSEFHEKAKHQMLFV